MASKHYQKRRSFTRSSLLFFDHNILLYCKECVLFLHVPWISYDENYTITDISNPVEKAVCRVSYLTDMMKLIEDTVKEVDPDIYKWLLNGVTTDKSYEYLNQKMGLPMSRSAYYERYRKYFFLLSKKR